MVVYSGHLSLPTLELRIVVDHPLTQLHHLILSEFLLKQVFLSITIHALMFNKLQLVGRLISSQLDKLAIHPPRHQQEVLDVELEVEYHLAQEREVPPIPDDPSGVESVDLVDQVGGPGIPEFGVLVRQLVEHEYLGEHDVHHFVVVLLLVEEYVELAQHAHLETHGVDAVAHELHGQRESVLVVQRQLCVQYLPVLDVVALVDQPELQDVASELVDHLLGQLDQVTAYEVLPEVLRLIGHAVLLLDELVGFPLGVGEAADLGGHLVVEHGREVGFGSFDALAAAVHLEDVVFEYHVLELPTSGRVFVVFLYSSHSVEIVAFMDYLRELILLDKLLFPILVVYSVGMAGYATIDIAVYFEDIDELVPDVVEDVHRDEYYWLAQLVHLHHDFLLYRLRYGRYSCQR